MNSRADRGRWREQLSRLLAGPIDQSIPITVLAAHPDDETIGASALLARGDNPLVIYLTDGAPRDKKLWPPDFDGTREDYATLRRMEAMAALSHVGVGNDQVLWLGAVDQESIFQAVELSIKLGELLERRRPNLLITHPYEGGHPDHDAAALVARLAVRQLQRENALTLVEMTSYHARQGQCVTGEFLNGSLEEVCLQLTATDRERKRKIFDAYASQRLVLSAFETTQERWRKAPVYNFSQPPHAGKLWYECMGWPMTGERWRSAAAESHAKLELSCR